MPEQSDNSSLTPRELVRYSRHILLPGVGESGQEKLNNARVLLIGAGGLGSPAALYLASAGVGTLGIVDFDRVELHNLQRQILHGNSDVGRLKVESAAESIQAINPQCQVISHATRLETRNIRKLFAGYDLILDGSDNFPTRFLINDACFFLKKPLVYGSIFQFEGQASLFAPHLGTPCYRCLFPEIPEPGTIPSCAEAGVLGATCGVIGSIQAMEAIKFIVGTGDTLMGRLLVVRTGEMNFRTIDIRKDSDCPLCGNNPVITTLEAENYEYAKQCEVEADADAIVEDSCETPDNINVTPSGDLPDLSELPLEISPATVDRWIKSNMPFLLIDVREPWEYNICRLPVSDNIPMARLPAAIQHLPQDKAIILYCHHGMRSLHAALYLRNHGLKFTTSMQEGINGWSTNIDQSVPRY